MRLPARIAAVPSLARALSLVRVLAVSAAGAMALAPAHAQDVAPEPVTPTGLEPPPKPAPTHPGPRELVQVADPYLDMHTGPGRGYPVFHVAARGEWVELELRHTDWYKVRTRDGKEGWVNRRQLATTLAEAGGTRPFRDVLLDDYLARRAELGAGYGRFHHEPMIVFRGTWRFADTLSLEAAYGQVQGRYSGTDLWHLNLMVEPWSDERLSPYLGVGFGHFRNLPNLSLVQDLPTNARLADAAVGARWHVAERFVVRADYTLYTALLSDRKTTQYHAATLGLSFFF